MNCTQARGEITIRVLVADNSRIHTRLLAEALKRDTALEVIPFESDSSGLIAAAISQEADVLVISSELDEQPARGFEVLHEMRESQLKTRPVLLLDSSKGEAVVNAFRAGARGVFGKNGPLELLRKCVRCVYQGQIWANSEELSVVIGALANFPGIRTVNANGMSLLTARELQVVRCIAEGLTNQEIAKRLKLSRHTIKNYLFRIFGKLGVSSRIELLFVSLSQAGTEQARLEGTPKQARDRYSLDEADFLKKAAEAGLPAAQLALAQWYLGRRGHPQDLVHAYMWYLIATECALKGHGLITKMMTPQQIDEGREKASVWLSRWRHTSVGGRQGPDRTLRARAGGE